MRTFQRTLILLIIVLLSVFSTSVFAEGLPEDVKLVLDSVSLDPPITPKLLHEVADDSSVIEYVYKQDLIIDIGDPSDSTQIRFCLGRNKKPHIGSTQGITITVVIGNDCSFKITKWVSNHDDVYRSNIGNCQLSLSELFQKCKETEFFEAMKKAIQTGN